MEETLISQMDFIISMRAKGNRESLYSCQEDFVKKNGRFFSSQKFPREFLKYQGQKKLCFQNAYKLAQLFPGLTYVEGYAISEGIPIAFAHAFCVDMEGNVIDPTWDYQEKSTYFGVPFKMEYVNKTIVESGHYGIVDNWTRGFPLIRGKSGHLEKDFKFKALVLELK